MKAVLPSSVSERLGRITGGLVLSRWLQCHFFNYWNMYNYLFSSVALSSMRCNGFTHVYVRCFYFRGSYSFLPFACCIYLFILKRLCLEWRAADLFLLSGYLLLQPTRVLQSLSLFFIYIYVALFVGPWISTLFKPNEKLYFWSFRFIIYRLCFE